MKLNFGSILCQIIIGIYEIVLGIEIAMLKYIPTQHEVSTMYIGFGLIFLAFAVSNVFKAKKEK